MYIQIGPGWIGLTICRLILTIRARQQQQRLTAQRAAQWADSAWQEDEIRRAVGRGTPTLLLGTSTRALNRSLDNIRAASDMCVCPVCNGAVWRREDGTLYPHHRAVWWREDGALYQYIVECPGGAAWWAAPVMPATVPPLSTGLLSLMTRE